ncbi:MAG: hypothetical protein NVSMB64_18810 [Candidatus Velthaea sp.]
MNLGERRLQLGSFLKSMRGRVAPSDFDLPVHRRRRVAGLRREEVAMLAGISTTWYTQLESGAPITVSPALLSRIADILRLSALERALLFSLAIVEMQSVLSALPDLRYLAGSRIAEASLEREIAVVLQTHRSLKTQMYGAIVHGTVEALEPHLDEQRCPIGIWLHDDLSPLYRRSAHYCRASRAHTAFHREIEKITQAALDHGAMRAQSMLAGTSRYVLASAALERSFSRWRESAATPLAS